MEKNKENPWVGRAVIRGSMRRGGQIKPSYFYPWLYLVFVCLFLLPTLPAQAAVIRSVEEFCRNYSQEDVACVCFQGAGSPGECTDEFDGNIFDGARVSETCFLKSDDRSKTCYAYDLAIQSTAEGKAGEETVPLDENPNDGYIPQGGEQCSYGSDQEAKKECEDTYNISTSSVEYSITKQCSRKSGLVGGEKTTWCFTLLDTEDVDKTQDSLDQCGSHTNSDGNRVECFDSLEICQAFQDGLEEEHGNVVIESCPNNEEEAGQCAGQDPQYCIMIRKGEGSIGDEFVCSQIRWYEDIGGRVLRLVAWVVPFFEREDLKSDEVWQGLALEECEAERKIYITANSSAKVPACVPKIDHFWSAILGGEHYYMCFDASDLLRVSEETADKIREAQAQKELDAREQARRAADEARERTWAEIYKEGQLVPCYGVGDPDKEDEDGIRAHCDWNALIQLANNVISFAIRLAAVILVIVILIAGWGLITSRGNPQALTDARAKLFKAILGFAIVVCAWLIVNTVMNTLLDKKFENDEIINLLEDGTP